ncbi:MAG: hypothetical protein BGO01_08670 [Armatimonadetes bacterium 55-13]|nr:hypothetical protein [Armatimonadota bacterium]OJU62028.1 MAG: hypothetical protein BGO01_08670 [Armatimonadetes bacterium 55-13]
MLSLLAVTALALVKFPGGTPNEFADSIVDSTKQNAIIVQGDAAMVDDCEYEPADFNEMARLIRNQTDLMILPGLDMVLSDGMLSQKLVTATQPTRIIRRRSRGNQQVLGSNSGDKEAVKPLSLSAVELQPTAIKDGKITFATKKQERLDLSSLQKLLSQPLDIHWIYKDATVCLNVTDMPEETFLKWMAKGIGARFVQGSKGFSFALNAEEIKKRALATLNAQKDSEDAKVADAVTARKRLFQIACLNGISSGQLATALATPGGQVRIELNQRSPLTRTAVTYVQDLEKLQMQGVQQGRGQRNVVSVMRRLDSSRPVYLTMDAQFQVSLEIPIVDNRGRPAGTIRF